MNIELLKKLGNIDQLAGITLNAATNQKEVTDANGKVVFFGGGQFGSDITLAEGQDGKYEITYDSITNTVTFKLVEKLEPNPNAGAENADIRFIGSFNDWDTGAYGEDDYKLTLSEDGKTFVGTFEITIDMYRDYTIEEGPYGEACAAIKLYDIANSQWISVKDGDNAFLMAGVYHFSYVSGSGYFTVWADGEDGPTTPSTPSTPSDVAGKVYFVPSAAWKADNSVYGAWFWGGSQAGVFVAATDEDGDGIYECIVPDECVQVIFVDFNSGSSELVWDNKREQTADLNLPEEGENVYFHIANNAWGNKEGPVVEPAGAVDYYLVGYINNVDLGFGTDASTIPADYKFVDGKLTATFTADSYVFVKSVNEKGKNVAFFWAPAYEEGKTVTLQIGANEKMKVPGNVEITFTLTVNEDGTLTLVAEY
jgi:hypothetical protein